MNKYKYETHLHTKQGSACGINTGAEMADYYKSLGYAGMVVTDHFLNGNTAVPRDLPWEEKMELFCSGYEDAKKRGEQIDFDVFFGLEYAFHGTEFLIYNINKKWLIENPQIIEPNLKQGLKRFKESGAFIIHAHPFRIAPYIDMFRLLPDFTDAVETVNMHNGEIQNQRASGYASMYEMAGISGGDTHSVGDVTGGIEVNKRIKTMEEFISVIKNENYSIIKK